MLTHKGTQKIHTDRLFLRKLTPSDAQDFFTHLVNDKRVLRYTAWPYHTTVSQTEKMLISWSESYKKSAFYNWGIEFDGKIIGNITVYRIYEDVCTLEIGYCLGYDYWNRGFATEAAKAVIDFLFTEINAKKIIVSFASANASSGRVAEKCGMTYIRTSPQAFITTDGETVDIIEYEKNRCVD